MADEYWAKWYLLADSIVKNRTDGALIRLITQIKPDESEADADRRLQSFMRAALPRLTEFLPSSQRSADQLRRVALSESVRREYRAQYVSTDSSRARQDSAPHLLIFAALSAAGCSSPEERAQSYYDSGMKLLAAHDDQKAAIEFRNAVKLKKDFLPAWRGLAQAEEDSIVGKIGSRVAIDLGSRSQG